jgi:hypothetical protein
MYLGAAAVRDLHFRAAEILVENGQIDEAMEQFQTAQDVAERTRLLLEFAPVYIGTGRSRTIAAWIRALPVPWVESNAWLLYWLGVSSFGHWDDRPLQQLERAYTLFAREGAADGIYLTCAAAMQGVVQDGTDFTRLDLWLERFESLEKSGPTCPEPFLPMVATGMMLASAFRRVDAAHNRKWVDLAMDLAGRSSDLAHRIMNGGFLAMYLALYERPARAVPILEMLRAFTRDAEPSALLAITILQADALCAWLEGDNEACIERVREALAIAARTGVFVWNDFILGLGVGACLGLEDLGAVREFLEPMAEIAERRGGFPAAIYHGYASWDAQDRGDAIRALHHAELANASAEKEGPPFGYTFTLVLLAQALWQVGRPRDAEAALLHAKRRAEEAACAVHLHGCYLIESDLAWDEDRVRALTCLRQGFAYAHQRGYQNAYGVNRGTLERAAIRALEHGIEPEHVFLRIRKNRLTPARVPARLEVWPWRYRFRLFDAFEMIAADSPLDRPSPAPHGSALPRGMPLRLLEVLLVFGARGVRDVQMIDALWPDAEGDAGRRVFDTTLHRLRRQLGDIDVIRMNDGRLYLDEQRCWLDTWAFDDLTAEAERQIASAAPIPLLVDLNRQILRIYRGPVLANGNVSAPWARGSRERYANKFRRLAQSLGQALERVGARSDAAALYARSSELDRSSPASQPVPLKS